MTEETLLQALSDPALRKELRKDFDNFCYIYLSHAFNREPAPFHPEMMASISDPDIPFLEVMGFRGSAKSTIGSWAYPLFAALEQPRLWEFILLISDSNSQASIMIYNLKNELDTNALLKLDYGSINGDYVDDWTLEGEDWQKQNMVLSSGVRILARSRGQRVRGLRHKEFRPRLIVVDDPEDLKAINTQELRDKTDRWFTGEVIPAMDAIVKKIVLIGNLLHNDSLIARMSKHRLFKVLAYPLIKEGVCQWPAMYPTQQALDDTRDLAGFVGWNREYLLQVVPDEGQDVVPDDIQYYDEDPFDDGNYIVRGVDLAISTEQTADYTSVVSGEIAMVEEKATIYVQPNPVIRRMNFRDTMETFDNLRYSTNMSQQWYVEDVQYQRVAIEEMERAAFDVFPVRPTRDKRSRLRVAARYIKNGTVRFPRTGCELLLNQLFGFGIEKHDDAVDALVYMILGAVGEGIAPMKIHYI